MSYKWLLTRLFFHTSPQKNSLFSFFHFISCISNDDDDDDDDDSDGDNDDDDDNDDDNYDNGDGNDTNDGRPRKIKTFIYYQLSKFNINNSFTFSAKNHVIWRCFQNTSHPGYVCYMPSWALRLYHYPYSP